MPLTHYERSKKFASSEYGTTSKRLAGHSQYQLGYCAITTSSLSADALCSPSGYLYSRESILDYLLTTTQTLRKQQKAYDEQADKKGRQQDEASRKRTRDKFEKSQQLIAKNDVKSAKTVAKEDFKRSSYWLADSQPEAVSHDLEKPPDRPPSPNSGSPLKRKDLWPATIKWDGSVVVCALSDKAIKSQPATAYWIDKKVPGLVVLSSVFDDFAKDKVCSISGQKIKHVRRLQRSGTGYASSSQSAEVKIYRPTIT